MCWCRDGDRLSGGAPFGCNTVTDPMENSPDGMGGNPTRWENTKKRE